MISVGCRRAGKTGDVRRVADADQIQLQGRRHDKLGADADRPLRLLRREDSSGADVKIFPRRQCFDNVERSRHTESNLDELDAAFRRCLRER